MSKITLIEDNEEWMVSYSRELDSAIGKAARTLSAARQFHNGEVATAGINASEALELYKNRVAKTYIEFQYEIERIIPNIFRTIHNSMECYMILIIGNILLHTCTQ
jgi:uncharacterized secreted protein with C-terminal beta-propeller domain